MKNKEDDCVVCGQLVAGSQMYEISGKTYCKFHYRRKKDIEKTKKSTREKYKSFRKLIATGLDS